MTGVTYKDAGVDLDVYRQSMARLPRLMHRTFSPRVQKLDGGFAGLFRLDFANPLFARNYQEPVLVAGTDGVGTKLKVAVLTESHSTVGIDLVAMCVNDVLCCGAEPLFFLDYVAMSRDDPQLLEMLVTGISDGCLEADCALLGGETAIMPDLYSGDDYDLAGFCVGVVEGRRVIDGSRIVPGDTVLGVASSGLHSNGFSLVRKIVFERAGLGVHDMVAELGQTVGAALMTPTRIYARPVRRLLNQFQAEEAIHGIAHVTGGGLHENLERILPAEIRVSIDRNSWQPHPVFPWLQRIGGVDDDEMARVFNMGIGLVLVVGYDFAEAIRGELEADGLATRVIGTVQAGSRRVSWS